MLSKFLVVVATCASFVSAQQESSSALPDMGSTQQDLTIEPNSVGLALRQSWCRANIATCPRVCPDGIITRNTCDANNLSYECTCKTGSDPNLAEYKETLPFFVCQTWRDQCVARNPNDLESQTACLEVECGNKNATDAVSTSSSMASATPTESASSVTPETATATATDEDAESTTAAATSFAPAILPLGLLIFFGFMM